MNGDLIQINLKYIDLIETVIFLSIKVIYVSLIASREKVHSFDGQTDCQHFPCLPKYKHC